MKQQTRTSKIKKCVPFIKNHLLHFMHEILYRHTWNCNIPWSKLNMSGEEIKSYLLLPISKRQSVGEGLKVENLNNSTFFFSLNDNFFGLELAIQAKVFALCYLDWGHHFLFCEWQYTPAVDHTGEQIAIIAVYIKQKALIRFWRVGCCYCCCWGILLQVIYLIICLYALLVPASNRISNRACKKPLFSERVL